MTLTLNNKLLGIGIRLTNTELPTKVQMSFVDIERTLLEATQEFESDARLASLIFSWIKVHGNYVIVEKLRKIRDQINDHKHDWISAIAAFALSEGLHKWKPLVKKSKQPLQLFPKVITDSAVQLKGSEPWAKSANAIIPTGSIRIRESDIVSPKELIRINRQYKNRYLYGPSWRADIITAIEFGKTNATSISKYLGCSYEPAYRILNEYKLAVG